MSSFIADVYDACLYSWNLDRPTTEWYNDMRPSVRRILAFIHKAVISSWFEYTICKFILLIVKTSVKTISDEVIQTIFFSALRSGTINTLIVLSMPSFLLLGGPISAFFAGLTAELHYCTFYSPFPSYKWKKPSAFLFQAWQCLPMVWFWLCKRVWWGHLQKTLLVFMHHGSRISLLLVSILCTISGGFLLGYWKSFFFPIVYYSVFLTAPVPGWCLLWHIPSIFTPPSSLYFGWCDTWKWNRVADASDELVISLEAFRSAAFSTTSKALSID